MRTQMIAILVLAAFILAVIFMVSPGATIIANETSGEIYGIDVFGIAGNTDELPAQRLAKH